MEASETDRRRFPVGRHRTVVQYVAAEVAGHVGEIAAFPIRLREKVLSFSEADLEKRYRPGGWTARQVIHHVSDSHTHAYIRFKWALTEDKPTIKPYFEERWAELVDSRTHPVESALQVVDAMHSRWVALLRTMDEAAFRRSFFHPETGKEIALFDSLAIYAWHGRHHLAHLDLALAS